MTRNPLMCLVGTIGFEPTTSTVVRLYKDLKWFCLLLFLGLVSI